jgi:glycosyltransferase involved in cell wall biosynthesis
MSNVRDKNIKLSIAVLTYKHETYVREALDGIFMQKTDFDFEIVIADDCSPDNTQKIIEEYIERFPNVNIRTIFQPTNVGMWQNLKALLNALSGEYFAFVEGDDYWTDADKLQQQIDFLEANPDFVCCFHAATVIKDPKSKNILSFKRYPQNPVAETTTILDLLKDGNYVPSASMVQRNVFKGNFPDYIFDKRSYPDTMLHFLQASKGKYRYIDKEMSVYRINVGGITENKTKVMNFVAMEFMLLFSDEFSDAKWNKEHRAALQKYYYGLLESYRVEGDKVKIKEYMKKIKANRHFDNKYAHNFLRKVCFFIY